MFNFFESCLSLKQKKRGYTIRQQIGRGSYGEVFLVTKGGKEYALKTIKLLPRFDDSKRILREVQVLKFLVSCPYSVHLIDGWIDKDEQVNLVLELYEHDLRQVIQARFDFTEHHLKYISRQLFVGLAYLHSAGILHRDIKPANILVNQADCRVVLCDYNLSSFHNLLDDRVIGTQEVASRWYRAPELLLKQPYGSGIDVWAVGCILAEAALLKTLWFSVDEKQQIDLMVSTLNPSENDKIELKMDTKEHPLNKSIELPSHFSQLFTDFLLSILSFAPSKRLSAEQALQHPWLSNLYDPPLILCENLAEFAESTPRTVRYMIASELIESSIKTASSKSGNKK